MAEVAVTVEDIRAVWSDPTLTRKAAAARLGITHQALASRAKRLGLPMRPRNYQCPEIARARDARVRDVWLRADLTRREQAHEAGLALSALTARARRLGLPTRRRAADRRIPAARIREVWLDPCLTVRQAADMVGLAPSNLRRRAKAMGLDPRRPRRCPVAAAPPCAALFGEMWEAHVRADDIAAHFSIHERTVNLRARRFGLARRTPPSPPSKLISLDRFWIQRREDELRVSLSAAAQGENAALWQQRMDDRAADHVPSRLVSQRHLLRDELRARGISLTHLARDLGQPYSAVDMVISGRRRSTRIELALAAVLEGPIPA